MKEFLKDKILIFVIGLLVGAIIATGCYFCYAKTHKGNNHGDRPQVMMQNGDHKGMPNGTPPQMSTSNGNNSQEQAQNGNAPSGMPQAPNTTSETTNSNS